MKRKFCKCGKEIIVDEEDFVKIQFHSWRCYRGKGTVRTAVGGVDICIARFIINIPEGLVPDHINRDIHDNRKSNLRAVTRRENNFNSSRVLLAKRPLRNFKKGPELYGLRPIQ